MWQAIVDQTIWHSRNPQTDLHFRSSLASAAIAASQQVPECFVCEHVYAALLVNYFGLSSDAITFGSNLNDPKPETLFALGRAGILAPNLSVEGYRTFALSETCIALHDSDLQRATDGVLALAAMAAGARNSFSWVEYRFVLQATKFLSVLSSCFPTRLNSRLVAVAADMLNDRR